jgi:Fe2+ transport system protein FeoA
MQFFARRQGKFHCAHQHCNHGRHTHLQGSTIYDFPKDSQVQIVAIRGPKCNRCQLISKGFVPGTTLTILENTPGKTCLVSIDNRKITIDQNSAFLLYVEAV